MRESRCERGAILVMVAICLLVLTVFSAVVVDYGIMWIARGQAQNAADAAALSGAWARVVDDQTNPPASKTSGVVWASAVKVAEQNRVWGQAPPAASLALDWTCPTGGSTKCVVVDLWRNGTHASTALPTAFANLVGINSQGVRAHAVAELTGANASTCMRPWFLLDAYTDVDHNDTYNSPPDTYTNPGYTDAQIGQSIIFHDNMSPSGYGQIDVGSGGNAIQDAIEGCVDNSTYHIGQSIPTKPGGTVGPERHGVDNVMGWDPYATWNPVTKVVENSCANTGTCYCNGQACPNGGTVSPRVFVVPICSPTQADCRDGGPSNGNVTITNFLTFLLMGHQGNGNNLDIQAILIGGAGEMVTGGGTSPAPFLKVVRLIR